MINNASNDLLGFNNSINNTNSANGIGSLNNNNNNNNSNIIGTSFDNILASKMQNINSNILTNNSANNNYSGYGMGIDQSLNNNSLFTAMLSDENAINNYANLNSDKKLDIWQNVALLLRDDPSEENMQTALMLLLMQMIGEQKSKSNNNNLLSNVALGANAPTAIGNTAVMDNNSNAKIGDSIADISAQYLQNEGDFSVFKDRLTNSNNLTNIDYQSIIKANNSTTIPYNSWVPSNPTLTNAEGSRNSEAYRAVLDQFDVANNGRYKNNKLGRKETYCNIYTWDVTKAMGAEVPHYIDANNAPSTMGVKGARELNANATYDWLKNHGSKYGWNEISAEEAQKLANAGYPVVASWKNPTGASGHLQMVCPSKDGSYDSSKGVTVAQAGSTRTNYSYMLNTMGRSKMSAVKYYAHN